ncbi:hypothetical protein [uncultured Rikenella sp.]|uniref:phage upper tail fiber protein n=1 Tax=uncultured Rikenella sp. TaxID=368003 RepID=UPI0025ED1F42|nr:hypothetical protein [uncultured Rikenella sp.]
MTREELEQLSDDTFFDNNKGEIQPEAHRQFNAQLIGFIDSCLEAAKQYAVTKIGELVGGSPEQLDTLRELAAALGDDPNFASTVMQLIGEKLPAASYTADDVLAKLQTVDGSGSGLDADMTDGIHLWRGTQAAYNAIADKDANTLYIVTD